MNVIAIISYFGGTHRMKLEKTDDGRFQLYFFVRCEADYTMFVPSDSDRTMTFFTLTDAWEEAKRHVGGADA